MGNDEFCDNYKDYFNKNSKFSKYNGITVIKLEKGYAEVEMAIVNSSLNVLGTLHGGALFTLADTAAGAASLAYGVTCVTLNGSVNYIKPAMCGKLKAIAKEVSRGRKIGIYDVSIIHENGELKCTPEIRHKNQR